MSKKSINLENVGDMVQVLIAHSYLEEVKYSLDDYSHRVWDNPEEGELWNKEYYALRYVSKSNFTTYDAGQPVFDQAGYEAAELAYIEKSRELSACRPGEHSVVDWALSGSGSSSSSFSLSNELAAQIDAIWKKRAPYLGASYSKRVGLLTLKGILKRLGADSGLNEKIQAAAAQAEHAEKVRHVNVQRSYIRRSAQEILGRLDGAKLGEEIEQIKILIENLAVLQDEEI